MYSWLITSACRLTPKPARFCVSRRAQRITQKRSGLGAAEAGVRAHQMSCKPRMETPKIYLRELQLSDVDSWYSYLSVPEVVEHTSWNLESKQDLENLATLYNLEDPESQIRFAIIDKSSGDLIGTIGFHSVSEASHSAEIAYDIHPDFWGRGIATQACNLVVEWGFKCRKFIRIQACILPSNLASENVLHKCGFVPEGIRSSFRKVRGEPKDFMLYSIALKKGKDNS
tara:strand:- start:683 stop:1366 length:684 start_codon:yes stop_codon:yes gene_type:complete